MGGGLMDGRPFDLNLVRTLLRVDVFATAQSGIVARLKKGAQPVEATSTVLSKIGDDAYHQARASVLPKRDPTTTSRTGRAITAGSPRQKRRGD